MALTSEMAPAYELASSYCQMLTLQVLLLGVIHSPTDLEELSYSQSASN